MAEFLTYIDKQDATALAFFLVSWIGYAQYTKYQTRYPSLVSVTNRYRLQWMRSMLKRENRSVDAIIIGNLMRSITFSANTTIFILAGLIGMLSYRDKVGEIISAIPFAKAMTPVMWEIKIFLLILIFVYAFFKYTWSLRQQNYTSILVASAPIDAEVTPEHDHIAQKAAFLAGNAADHFNSGLRAYYFGLAVLAWFIHPTLFMIATAFVIYVTQKREYRSRTLHRLVQDA
mgnify:CR=1 FL=1